MMLLTGTGKFPYVRINLAHWPVVTLLLLALPCAFGQMGAFDSGSDGSDGALFIEGTLAPVADFAYAYDPARQEVIAFGGDLYSGPEVNHTYVFDGVSWRRTARTDGPSSREGAIMAYDAPRQQIVLFGGDSGESDTWTWDGSSWTEVITTTAPPTVYSGLHAMAFDESTGLVTMVLQESFTSEELQTWTFDGVTWTQQAATVPRKLDHQMVYDPGLGQLVLLTRDPEGGLDTWLFDGASWSSVPTESLPVTFASDGALVYDARGDYVAFYGNDEAYKFDGSDWSPIEGIPFPFDFGLGAAVYFPSLDALLRMNGSTRPDTGGVRRDNDTWAWYGDNSVEQLTKGTYEFDMSGKADGLWQYTTIDIGPNVEVTFQRNAANTPVRWLASGDVVIEGTVNLSATIRHDENSFGFTTGLGAHGGPGGFSGASAAPLGREFVIPGEGPGGGFYDGATISTRDGSFTSYGNAWLYPTIGGSGGSTVGSGGGGGGGGGAIVIASSGEIVLNGLIQALGERQSNSTASSNGSGGSVLLRANRVDGVGDISVGNGRKRIEAWERPLVSSLSNVNVVREQGLPLLPTDTEATEYKLWIDSVGGAAVADPPRSHDSLVDPDVVVSGAGALLVVVKGENLPAGTMIDLFVSLPDGGVIEPSPETYDGTQATFALNLPEGFGAIAAEARIPAQN